MPTRRPLRSARRRRMAYLRRGPRSQASPRRWGRIPREKGSSALNAARTYLRKPSAARSAARDSTESARWIADLDKRESRVRFIPPRPYVGSTTWVPEEEDLGHARR